MMNILVFLDTEFEDLRADAGLISIGLVTSDGKKSFYRELSDTWKRRNSSEFVLRHVVPHLEGKGIPKEQLITELTEWITALNGPVTIVTDSMQWDWGWIQKLFYGRWPENLSKQPSLLTMNYLVNFDRFEHQLKKAQETLRVHHALDDAEANRLAWMLSGGSID